ncbi:Cna B-type domain-containing protein [Proteiniclasticum sp. C24MP]|uniref:Cna B-type domain-containing protein n=1 Tax=Proteiniclasticum sp. C24MP TaxID=3374101 RepID=UPI0037550C64
MKVGKTLRSLLSFFIAFAMVFPGAVKVNAADTSYPYDVQNNIILDADITGTSINDHTYAKAFWTYGSTVYLMVESTHDAEAIVLANGGNSYRSTTFTAFDPGDTVTVDKTYYPNETQGNTKDAHLSVFEFPLSEILKLGVTGGSYAITYESEQGLGHWIYGTLTIHIPRAKVEVSKTWENGPMDDVSIQLYRKLKDADDTTYAPVGNAFTLTTENPTKTISDLDFTDNIGRIYTYTAKEVNLGEGYSSSVDVTGPTLVEGVQVFTIAIKNTYTPPMTDIKVTKVWKDDNDTSGRPSSLTYYLYADDDPVAVRTQTVYSPNWNFTFEDLPKTKYDGTLIKYSVKEAPVDGYETSIDGLTVTNVRTALTDVEVMKLWKDGDDPSGRPPSVTFNLFANGVKIDSVELTSLMSWKHTFEDLDKYDENGKLIKYTVTEDAVTGYTPTIDGLTITNLRVGKVDIPVEKFWMDDGSEGRPSSVTINLLANGEEVAQKDITADMDWKYTFSQMDKYDDMGKLIVYTITEDPVEGYKSDVKGFEVTNTKTGTTDIDVSKIWLDDNATGARPSSVTIYLLANGNQVDSIQLTAEGSWKHTFIDKPAYDTEGKAITYTITEGEVPGYIGTVDGFEVTNVRVGTTEVSVDKVWMDDNDTSSRPEFITVNLLANGMKVDSMDITAGMDWEYIFEDLDKYDDKGKLIVYTITEEAVTGYNTSIDGYTITNVRTGERDIPVEKFWKDEGPEGRPEFITINLLANGVKVEEAKLTSLMEWKYTFIEVPEFDENGKKITYTITENNIDGYSGKVSGFTITNTRTGDKDIPVEKLWLDGDDPSARPSSITVSLLANGTVVDTAEITKETGWTYIFEDKPIYDEDGKTITYTIREKAVEYYTSSVDGFTITNLRTGEIDIPVEKIWLDNGTRTIDKITVNLYKQVTSQPPMEMNAEIVTPSAVALVLVDTLELNAANGWKDTFTDLPEFDEKGYLIDYFLEEIPVDGYSTSIVENEDGSFTITNLRTGITSVSGTKSWLDEEGTSMRPESITVILMRNGEEYDRMDVSEVDGLWTYLFEDLPEFDDKGIAYEYTIDEVSVQGYETSYDGFDIFNLRTGMIDIPVEKIWLDNGERAIEEITVNLYRKVDMEEVLAADAEEASASESMEFVKALVLNAENEWKGTFEDLPEFDDKGYPIEYFLEEEAVEGYTGTMTMNEDGSYTFTNLRTGIIDIAGEKTWFDADEEARPESITVVLMRNGEEYDRMEVSEVEGLWTYLFEDLPEFDEEGIEYLYEIEELPVEGYNTFIVGFDIQNTRTGITNVNGEKTWDDLLNRPESITINLLRNGVEINEMLVTEDEEGKWLYSFTDLPEFDEDGIPYTYTVTEETLSGYEPTVEGYNIMNRQLRGTLRIVKIDDFDIPVEDVIFEIEDEDGVLIDTVSTDEDGIAEIVLPLGTYTVREIYAPEDYIMDDEEKTVTLDEDGETVELTVVNILEIEEVEPLPLPKPTLPKTGAQSSFIWYGFGAMLALAGFTLLRKKKTSI